jgi:RNA polymerase sigma factor (sigma-70 family)
MSAYLNDSDLINACLNKNESAWRELVDRYTRLVYSIALRAGLSKSDADDVFQNVFAIVFRQLRTLRDQKLIVAWIIRITYHEAHRVGRQYAASPEIPDSFPDASDLPEEQVQTWERRYQVRLGLDQLGQPCRDLLQALFLESPTPPYDEIARRLGIPTGSIGPTRARCFKKLETILIKIGIRY